MNTQEKYRHWMIGLGLISIPVNPTNLDKVFVKNDMPEEEACSGRPKCGKKVLLPYERRLQIIAEVKKILKKKNSRNCDVYHELLKSGLLLGEDGLTMAESSFSEYMTRARKELNPDAIKKQTVIVKMYQESQIENVRERVRSIKNFVKSDVRYVRQVLIEAGLIKVQKTNRIYMRKAA